MSVHEKKGFLARIFGGKTSCCCNIRVEEVPEEDTETKNKKRPSTCCGGTSAVRDDARSDGQP